ncbi:MAG: Flp pilus assembly complex ATPase component TadA [Clostridia bacterium]|nr:Flp pilus assembly complex ATPase component TadA [Clostridia bacterium]
MSIETTQLKELTALEESGLTNAAALTEALRLFSPADAAVLRACALQIRGTVQEIRVYTGKAVVFCTDGGMRFVQRAGGLASFAGAAPLTLDRDAVFALVTAAADHAPFLHEKELQSAYLTKSGCRVGICGFAPDGRLLPGGITSVNIRLPYPSGAFSLDPAARALLADAEGLLVAGPPGCGKTTFLKKCAALLAGPELGWRRTAVIDERGEFYPALNADPDVITADILRGTEKAAGIQTALRLFSPEYVICDEIGGEKETEGMLEGLNSGVRFFASMHAGSPAQLFRRRQFVSLWEAGVFSHAVFLSARRKGRVESVIKQGEDPI